jgi:hypothetical protein
VLDPAFFRPSAKQWRSQRIGLTIEPMNRLAILATCLFGLGTLTLAAIAQAGNSGGPPFELIEETIVDKRGAPTHGGFGRHPTAETSNFKLDGGFRWFDEGSVPPGLPPDNYSDAVEYELDSSAGAVPSGFQTAVTNGVETVDNYVDTRNFVRDDNTPTTNPCGGSNRIEWGPIDGAGGTVAFSQACKARATGGMKLVVGIRIRFDSDDAFSNAPSASEIDAESVAAHEFGHTAGLGHVTKWQDGCLTMYNLIPPGATYKRALGWGDKVGLDQLYAVPDTNPRGLCA